jgi:hypothetical protein
LGFGLGLGSGLGSGLGLGLGLGLELGLGFGTLTLTLTVTLTRRVYGPAEECINSAGRFLLRTNGFVRAEDIAWAMT